MSDTGISIIIPARNEAAVIGPAIDRAAAGSPREIIVVDGASTDGTAGAAEARGARVVRSGPGRGPQMNRGARAATGDALLFLHADTLLPSGYEDHVRRVLGERGVSGGAFRLAIDAPGRAFRVIERAVNWRSRRLGMPYGDQALFVRPATFRRAGGYPAIAVMEDFELVRRLKRLGRIALALVPVVTSARRWRDCGILRTTVLNQACVAAYMFGAAPDRIAGWREKHSLDGRAGGVRGTGPSAPAATGSR